MRFDCGTDGYRVGPLDSIALRHRQQRRVQRKLQECEIRHLPVAIAKKEGGIRRSEAIRMNRQEDMVGSAKTLLRQGGIFGTQAKGLFLFRSVIPHQEASARVFRQSRDGTSHVAVEYRFEVEYRGCAIKGPSEQESCLEGLTSYTLQTLFQSLNYVEIEMHSHRASRKPPDVMLRVGWHVSQRGCHVGSLKGIGAK